MEATKSVGGRRGGGRKKAVSKSLRVGLLFPVGRIGRYAQRVATKMLIYMVVVLVYLAAEVWELAGNTICHNKKSRINPRHMLMVLRNDEELRKLLQGVTIASGGVLNINPLLLPKKSSTD